MATSERPQLRGLAIAGLAYGRPSFASWRVLRPLGVLAVLASTLMSARSARAGDVVLGAQIGPRAGLDAPFAGGGFGGVIGLMFPSLDTEARSRTRFGFAFEPSVVIMRGSGGTLGGTDLALVSRFHWHVGGDVFIGPRAGIAGHFYQFRPDGAAENSFETRQLGFQIGPELFVVISRRLSVQIHLDYLSTSEELDEKPFAHPEHALDLVTGVVASF